MTSAIETVDSTLALENRVAVLNIARDDFHPEWNYTIAPRRRE